MEYRELVFEFGIKNWGCVFELGCEFGFISDLVDVIIEVFFYVGVMNVLSLEVCQV